jgi:serine/threonine-protein kinase
VETIGRYRILKEIGRGAMGVVYHAVDPAIGRPVAIKTIRLGDAHKPQDREKLSERLFREARAAGGLSHPNIVTIYDMASEGDLAFIAMEFVDGASLEQIMAEGLEHHKGRILRVLHQTALALDYAHGRGVVHRDVKPANILITGDDVVKITDFGIAKAAVADQYTMTGAIVGTPNYMAPEQVQGLSLDGRADQFSLAVIAFELFTGEKPFEGEHLTTIVYKIVAEEPPAPHRLNPTLGLQIDGVLRKALAKNPEERFATCTEFLQALETACDATHGWIFLSRGAAASVPTVMEPPPRPVFSRWREEEPPRRRLSVLPVLGALIVAGGLIGLIAWQANPSKGRRAEDKAVQAEGQPPEPAAESRDRPSAMDAPAPAASAEPPAPAETRAAQEPAETSKAEPEPAPEPEAAKPAPPPRMTPRAKAPEPQPVHITTSPAGAVATLDNGSSCQTPCFLEAPPGRHTILIRMAGHQQERREVVVGSSPEDLPLVTLRRQGGTLMLASTPSGARISIDGRLRSETTPARLELAPGTYEVTVEKDGMRKTVRVEIRNGVTKYQPVQLGS